LIKTLLPTMPFLAAVIAGMFVFPFGAVGGGMAAGLAIGQIWTLVALARLESGDGCRLFVEVPRNLVARKQPTAFFRAPFEPPALDRVSRDDRLN